MSLNQLYKSFLLSFFPSFLRCILHMLTSFILSRPESSEVSVTLKVISFVGVLLSLQFKISLIANSRCLRCSFSTFSNNPAKNSSLRTTQRINGVQNIIKAGFHNVVINNRQHTLITLSMITMNTALKTAAVISPRAVDNTATDDTTVYFIGSNLISACVCVTYQFILLLIETEKERERERDSTQQQS